MRIATTNLDIYKRCHNKYEITYFPSVDELLQSPTSYDLYFIDPGALTQNHIDKIVCTKMKTSSTDYLFIMQKAQWKKIYLNDINYINIEHRSIVYHTTFGNESTSTLQTSFKKAVKLINHSSFLFLEPALLINLANIDTLQKDCIIFANGDKCYIPTTKYNLILDKLKDINY